ncbi:ALG-5 protein [Aphelenchoides avenae]|nr:ALG-5 protein [Aphelenchus avenae]
MASTSGGTNSRHGNGHEDQALDNAEASEWNERIRRSRPPQSLTNKWHGKLGRRLELVVNYYRPTQVAQRTVIQYRVEICHGNRGIPCSIRRLCRRYFWRAALDPANRRIFLSPNQLVYDDHALLFSVEPLRTVQNQPLRLLETIELPPFTYTEWCSLSRTNKEVPVKLTIQRTGDLEVGAPLTQASEQFLTLLLTQTPRRPAFDNKGTFVPRAQLWYAENNRIYELPYRGGFCRAITPATVLLRGLQCKMVGDAKGLPIANSALVGSLFAKAEFSLIDVYLIVKGEGALTEEDERDLRDYSLDNFQMLQMETELQGVKLRSRCGPKKNYQLHSIDRRPINDQYQVLFRSEALGGDVTILDYYRRRYNHELQYPNLPLFRMRPPERNIYIPMELVTISDEVSRIVRRLQPSDAAKVLEVRASYFVPSY